MEWFTTVDWGLLRAQKQTLLDLLSNNAVPAPDAEHLDGIINLLDDMQDTAVRSGAVLESVVFGEAT